MKRRTIAQCEAEIAALRKRLAQTARFARKANMASREKGDSVHYTLGRVQSLSAMTADAARGRRFTRWQDNRPTYRSAP